jgi:haloalkane dehalogenase
MNMNHKPRVLLTANYGPNELGMGEDMFDVMGARLARGHDPFRIGGFHHYYGLYLIAENITNPTTVLENPHWDEFDRELDQGYDVVGFQLKSLHTKKIARMMRRVREKCPDTKIVVGGYGVGTLGQPVPGDVEGDAVYIRENADHLCREEGVRFMRRILGDEPVDREITQYHLPLGNMAIAGIGKSDVPIPSVLVSLGCPNACDFCNTSAFFHHQKIYVADPGQTYHYMKNYIKRLNHRHFMVTLYDEDFFLDPDYVRELGRLLRSDKSTWGLKYAAFGSLRSLSQFTPEELRDLGCGSIWIGVESFMCGQGRTGDSYAKRQGAEIKQMIDGLQRQGIQITASLVLGFDFHDSENLKQDIDQFVDLKPMFYQISPLLPCPGTALYERMEEEDRILDSYNWEDLHLWSDDKFKPQNLKPGEIGRFYDYAHKQLRDNNGPPHLQLMENALDSFQAAKDATDEYRAYQAETSRRIALGLCIFMRSVRAHHPSARVRERARSLEQRCKNEVGSLTLFNRAASFYVSRNIRKLARSSQAPAVSDPPVRWSYYNTFDDRVWVRKGRQAKQPVPYV